MFVGGRTSIVGPIDLDSARSGLQDLAAGCIEDQYWLWDLPPVSLFRDSDRGGSTRNRHRNAVSLHLDLKLNMFLDIATGV